MEHSDWWHVKQAAIEYRNAVADVTAKKKDITSHEAHRKAAEAELGQLEAVAAQAKLRLLSQIESMKNEGRGI